MNEAESDCSYSQMMEPGKTYYLQNDKYPNYDVGENHCQYESVSPYYSVIKINCRFDIPPVSSSISMLTRI